MANLPIQENSGEEMALNRSEQNLGLAVPYLRVVHSAELVHPSFDYLISRRKRAMDIFIGILGVILLATMFPFVALVIKTTSSGPIFYRQRRMGLNGKPFDLIKFRTMGVDAESNGAEWSQPQDPRITSCGRMLRRLHIDEFPQWLHVLKGTMSVVGPRPERPELVEQILDFVPNFNLRLRAKPGITGLAQVNYKYTSTMIEARNKLRHDGVYINAASFWLDVRLVLRTFTRLWAFKAS